MKPPELESTVPSDLDRAVQIRQRIPAGGLFAGHEWRIGAEPFALGPDLVDEFHFLGRVLLQFYRAVNLLYRRSVEGAQPSWIAGWLDKGKPDRLIQLQRSLAFKGEVPRVIRPDLLLTETGIKLSELDSVPGGIGLTAWLNQTYTELWTSPQPSSTAPENPMPRRELVGGPAGMWRGFANIFAESPRVHVIISEEAATYRPEMEWLCEQMPAAFPSAAHREFRVHDPTFTDFRKGDGVYRFFELFDLPQVPNSGLIFRLAKEGQVRLTPPPKPIHEEKLLLALLWNRNLEGFWRRELGESFFERLLAWVPYSWVVDPAPLPPQGAIPQLNLTDWEQLKTLSKRDRNLILKISGFSQKAWGARGVYLGSDLSHADWSAAVDEARDSFSRSPYVLQRYHKPGIVRTSYCDFEAGAMIPMAGRVRLCPYFFVEGDRDAARPYLGGVLATICPADKKIIHGMKEAVLLPCSK